MPSYFEGASVMSLVLCVLPYLLRHILIMGGSMHFGPKAKVKKKNAKFSNSINNNQKKKKGLRLLFLFGDFYVLLAWLVLLLLREKGRGREI